MIYHLIKIILSKKNKLVLFCKTSFLLDFRNNIIPIELKRGRPFISNILFGKYKFFCIVTMSSKIILVYVALFVASSQSSNIPMLGWILYDAIWGIVEYGPEFPLALKSFWYREPFANPPQSSGLPISTDEEYVSYEYEEYEVPEYFQSEILL